MLGVKATWHSLLIQEPLSVGLTDGPAEVQGATCNSCRAVAHRHKQQDKARQRPFET